MDPSGMKERMRHCCDELPDCSHTPEGPRSHPEAGGADSQGMTVQVLSFTRALGRSWSAQAHSAEEGQPRLPAPPR